MNAYTIDSNILIYHLKGEIDVKDKLKTWLLQGDRLFISAITRIELLACLTNSPLVTRNIRDFRKIKEIALYPF